MFVLVDWCGFYLKYMKHLHINVDGKSTKKFYTIQPAAHNFNQKKKNKEEKSIEET